MEGGDISTRCPTGIEGFDAICQGGLVRNSSNVLVGGAGSGKTTFMLQFLWNGIQKHNENGMYCSFEPDIVETLKDAASYGWDFSGPNSEEKIKFLKFSPKTSLEDLKEELTKIVTRYRIQRICFDPVTVLTLNEEHRGKIRDTIYELASLMKRLRITSILADESIEDTAIYQEKTSWSDTDILKFLADGVIVLNPVGFSQEADRSLQITKMRRTNHIRTPVGMKIGSQGIELVNLQQVEVIKPEATEVQTTPQANPVQTPTPPIQQNTPPTAQIQSPNYSQNM